MMKNIILFALVVIFTNCCNSKKEIQTTINQSKIHTQMEKNNQNGTAITFKGNTIHTVGKLPELNSAATNVTLVANDLSEKSLSDFKGKNVILNIFPSLDTQTCATSVREFNQKVASMDNTVVLGISKDLPFASGRFCTAEGIENVITLSDFRSDFGHQYGVEIAEGPLKGLLSRAVIVINPEGKIVYEEQVPELTQEPDYEAALASIQ